MDPFGGLIMNVFFCRFFFSSLMKWQNAVYSDGSIHVVGTMSNSFPQTRFILIIKQPKSKT